MTKPKTIDEQLDNIILTFLPRTVLQKAQPAKDIPEIDNGTLAPEAQQEMKALITRAVLEGQIGLLKKLRVFARSHDSLDTTSHAWQTLATLKAELKKLKP